MNWSGLLFGPKGLTISACAICSVFSLANLLYFRIKNIRLIFHVIYDTTNQSVKEYTYRPHFFIFFMFLFSVVISDTVLSQFSIPSSLVNASFAVLLIGLNAALGIGTGIYHKSYKAITDLIDPSLPWPLKIAFFPLEMINVGIRGLMLIVRVHFFAFISHQILEELVHSCSHYGLSFNTSIIMILIIMLKMMELFTGLIRAYIFLTLACMFFGKFNKKIR